MSRLLYGNFDFEHQLARSHPSQLPARLERVNRELACCWCGLADPGDGIWLPGEVEKQFIPPLCALGMAEPQFVGPGKPWPAATRLVPWGWSPEMEAWGSGHGYRRDAPPREAVRAANSRRLSFELEQRWQIGLEGNALVHDVPGLVGALRELPSGHDRWVLKAEFGMAARERLQGAGTEPSDATLNWAKGRFIRGMALVLEPWVERIAEVGLQFEVPRGQGRVTGRGDADHERPRLLGVVPLLPDNQGQYRGSRLVMSTLDDSWQRAVAVAYKAAREIQGLGYFGPLGIDAMLYRDVDGQQRLRPLQDINARFTMGRLALELCERLKLEEPASWVHVKWNREDAATPEEWCSEAGRRIPKSARLLRTSPFHIDGEPTEHGSLLVIASTQEALCEAERVLFEAA